MDNSILTSSGVASVDQNGVVSSTLNNNTNLFLNTVNNLKTFIGNSSSTDTESIYGVINSWATNGSEDLLRLYNNQQNQFTTDITLYHTLKNTLSANDSYFSLLSTNTDLSYVWPNF